MTRATLNAPAHPVKLLSLGASGSGKTCSLISLVEAGYDIRIIDLDKGTPPLLSLIRHQCPERIGQVDIEPVGDVLRGSSSGVDIVKATGYIQTLKLMTKWSDESVPSEWGPNTVLVIDSLTRLGDYVFNYEKKLNPTVREPRQWYNFAQQRLRQFFDMVASDDFRTNVIVMAHVGLQETPNGEKQLPKSIGKALNPDIPSYFNNMIVTERKANGKRVINTVPTHDLDLKNEKPFAFSGQLPIETGLAEIFTTLQSNS